MRTGTIGAMIPHDTASTPAWLLGWLLGWLAGPVLGIGNGAVRELVYKDRLGDLQAHQVSTATLIAALGLYMAVLDRRWPIPKQRTAWAIGGVWTALTAFFEIGFGRLIDGSSWPELLEQYDLPHGRIWVLVLVWTAVGPATVRELRIHRAGR
jgi:hypothetical protein